MSAVRLTNALPTPSALTLGDRTSAYVNKVSLEMGTIVEVRFCNDQHKTHKLQTL